MRLFHLIAIFTISLFVSGCFGLGGLSIDFITGMVVDVNGRLLEGATVTVKSLDKEDKEEKGFVEITDATGIFSVKGMEDGKMYKVTVGRDGYVPQSKTIKFHSNAASSLTFVLSPGNATSQNFGQVGAVYQPHQPTVAPTPYDPQTARVYVAFANPPQAPGSQPSSGGPGSSGPRTLNEMPSVLYGADPMGGNIPFGASHSNPVQNLSANHISLLDLNSNRVVAAIPLPSRPYWIQFHPSGKVCYVADETKRIAVISPLHNNAIVSTIGVGEALIADFVVTRSGDRIYAALRSGIPQVAVIDTISNQVVKFFPLPQSSQFIGSQPGGITVTSDGGMILVTLGNSTGGELVLLETGNGTVVGRVPVGSMPLGVGITPDGQIATVANYASASVTLIDVPGRRSLGTIQTGTQPAKVAVRPDGQVVYVTNNGSGLLSIINPYTQAILTNITVGQNPMGVAVSPDGKRVYVANNGSSNVTIIDAVSGTLIGTTPPALGSRPYGISIRP